MSNPHRSHLPPEILDYIIDLLDDGRKTLKECCLVSKSWVPRTRKHLFAEVKFRSAAELELWKKTFPDQASSPTYHTHTLTVGFPGDFMATDAEQGGWIRSFSHVVQLRVYDYPSLVPFHEFSPLKCLLVDSQTLSNSDIFALISSLPLLEDLNLSVRGADDDAPNFSAPPTAFQPTSPALTGTLDLTVFERLGPTARRLLDLPNGLHFRRFSSAWLDEEDFQWITALVVGCSHTLESLSVTYCLNNNLNPTSVDLSEAMKLREVIFEPSLSVEWISLALQTITPKHRDLWQICINLSYHWFPTGSSVDVRQTIGEVVYGQWLTLDRILVQLWKSYSIHPKVTYSGFRREERVMGEFVGCLLPGATEEGIIDLAERDVYW